MLYEQTLNKGSARDKEGLTNLPGFIGREEAVTETMSKRDVLAQMDESERNILPVVDKVGKFVGTVDRPGLTASLILDVVDRLNAGKEASK